MSAIPKDSNRSRESAASYDEVTVMDEVTEGDDSDEDIEEELNDDRVSLDDILQEKNERIDALERANRVKDEQMQLLQQKFNETKTKHKEGIYWLQLELDRARRDNDATEEQMAELLNDLQGMTRLPETSESTELLKDATIKNFEQVFASMGNQISMIKTSAGEVVKTLKEDISDLMEDRASMELDLMNQLAILDNEKSIKEAEFSQELKSKNDAIKRLLSAGSSGASIDANELEEYETEISRLMEAKKRTEERLTKVREHADEEIQKLEMGNSKLEAKLDQAEEDLAIFRSESSAEETMRALQLISSEREDIVSSLDHVATVWEKADATILTLEDAMDKLRPENDTVVKGDRERLLSTLETAGLVHGQVKVSLMLLELKLRNQLQSIRNRNLSTGWVTPNDDKVVENMKYIQVDVLKVLGQVEHALSHQIREMEKRALEETKLMKNAIQKRSATLDTMQVEHKELENEINRLKSTKSQSTGTQINWTDQEGKPTGNSSNGAVLNGISKSILEQLHTEVLRILERVKEKNEQIQKLKDEIKDRKTTEEKLKKELKRIVRKTAPATKSVEGNKTKERGATSPKQSPKKTANIATISPSSPPPRSPTKAARRTSTGDMFASPKPLSPSVVNVTQGQHSRAGISPLQPSPREISRSRVPGFLLSPTPSVKKSLATAQE